MAIAPPSVGEKGRYEFIQGGLADFESLPVMQGPSFTPANIRPGGEVLASVGERNATLFKLCLREARSVPDGDALRTFALTLNHSGSWEPLPVDEVLRTATGAWEKQVSGSNWVGSGPKIITEASEFDRVFFPVNGQPNPAAADGFYLLSALRRCHFDKLTFVCANAMHKRLGWTVVKLQRARRFLEDAGCIVMVRPASAKDRCPALYSFGVQT